MSHATAETKAVLTVTINGRATEVPPGTTILQAARKNGVNVPTLCYLPKTHSIGSCRVCSVEVEGVASPVMSCNTPVADGMVVYTDTPKIVEFRKNMVEFILVNHPTDCPVCERSGECSLQNLTMQFGIQKPHWQTAEHKKVPVVDWGLIQYDRNLCIMCERCVYVCREVQGCAAYKVDGVGNAARINTVTGEKLDCDFCGQCISVCPVGALSSGMYFSARSWEVERTQTVCAHCGVGCTLYYNVKKGAVIRVTSRDSVGNNKGNLCARGRFGYEFVQSPQRMTSPLIKRGSGFEATDWDTALDFIAHNLKKYAGSKNAVAGLGSERDTNEDDYAFQKFFREALGSGNLENLANLHGPETASAVFKEFGDFPMNCTFGDVRRGGAFVFVGADGSNENPVLSNVVREAIFERGAEVALLYSKVATFLPSPKIKIVYDYDRLNKTLLALLDRLIDGVKKDGSFAGGAPVSDEFGRKVRSAAGSDLDDGLKAEVSEVVQLLRRRGDPVFFVGLEAQNHPQSKAIVRNVVNLAKITGGRVLLLREYCNSQGANDMGVAAGVLPGYAADARSELKEENELFGSAKAVIIADEDPLRRHPDYFEARAALDKAEFVAVFDQFYTQTAMSANVVLPTCTAAEMDGSFTNMEGRVQRVRKAVEPVGQSRPVWRIMADLAKRMGGDFGYNSVSDVSAEIAAKVPMYKDVEKDASYAGYALKSVQTQELKLETPAEMKDLKGSKIMAILPDHSLFSLGVYTDYCPSLGALRGKHYADFHVGGMPYVDLNPEDAARCGCSGDSTLLFKHPKKEWKARVCINPGVRVGSMRVPEELDKYARVRVVGTGGEADCANSAGMEGK
ncbi:MAG: molybdopterin-dependent oxidoreductase [Nitrospinae bacterium]|nr:molybdopterin-dependent oxidoreductase [Nitrospinota bacterium]